MILTDKYDKEYVRIEFDPDVERRLNFLKWRTEEKFREERSREKGWESYTGFLPVPVEETHVGD